LEREGCQAEVDRIIGCNFSGVETLGSYTRKGGLFLWSPTEDGLTHEAPEVQAAVCKRSDVIAFKTVTYGHTGQDSVLTFLERHPRLKVIDMVRDPRGIYASWRTTLPFSTIVNGEREGNPDAHDSGWWVGLEGICRSFAQNLRRSHPRIHRVKYEDLVLDPFRTMRAAYAFAGLTFGEAEAVWITQTFNANCEERDMGQFSGCHRNSSEPVARWEDVLSPYEKSLFLEDPRCREVAEHYGYPL
jgi:hypothetical protein